MSIKIIHQVVIHKLVWILISVEILMVEKLFGATLLILRLNSNTVTKSMIPTQKDYGVRKEQIIEELRQEQDLVLFAKTG